MKPEQIIILFAFIFAAIIIALIIYAFLHRKPKEIERHKTGFLATNIQLLKIKWDKNTEDISKEIGFDFHQIELALQEKQGLSISQINKVAEYFKMDKMILIYHDLREDYDKKW